VAALLGAAASQATVRRTTIATKGIDLEFMSLTSHSCISVGFIGDMILN
jgi:hypothetical protein